ncbi:MAG: bacterioferritin [Gammaproteobacteria bacterium]|nr:bacterioferritin [Gammaproteobacteria bacterium]
MFVCICQAVNDSAIRQAVTEGVSTFRDLSKRTGCGKQCGSCVEQAREVLDRAIAESTRPNPAPVLQVVAQA